MPAKPMLDGVELQLVQEIESDDQEVLAEHGVPALEGDFLQDLGRRVTRLSLTGVMTGEEAGDSLKTLREKFRAATPVPFVADIATATRVGKVLIEEMGVRELAGKPERFEYELTLREFIPPPKFVIEKPPDPPKPELPKVKTGKLIVEVIVEGQPSFDFSKVTVTVEGTKTDGSTLSQTPLTNRTGNEWTEEEWPTGQFTAKAVVTDPQSMSGSASATVREGETTKVTITLHPGAIIAKAFVVHFRFDNSFVEPCMTEVLQQVAKHASAHTGQKLLIVGHTDKTGSNQYNQSLSERRARSVFAYLTFGRDAVTSEAEWKTLRQRNLGGLPQIKDTWGTRQYQYMLQSLGFYSGNVDGEHGPITDAAVKSFRQSKGLPPGTTVDDAVWAALIHDYMASSSLAVPESQFLPNAKDSCNGGILKWLGCGEESPLPLPQPTTENPHRPYRRVEMLFVAAERLPCEVPQPDTFNLPAAGAVSPAWCLGPGNPSKHCCFATRDCANAAPGQFCIEPVETETVIVRGSMKNEDGTPAAGVKYVLIAPDGEFMDGEAAGGARRGDGNFGVTKQDGTFEYPDKPKGVGIFTMEVSGPFVARLADEPRSAAKGNSLCKRLGEDSRFDIILSGRPIGARVEMRILIQEQETGALLALEDAWVYWREEGQLVLLRTDRSGRVFSRSQEAERTRPESYTERFTTIEGTRVGIFHSFGATPIPDALLEEQPDAFVEVVVTSSTGTEESASRQLAFGDAQPGAPAVPPAGPAQSATATVPSIQVQLAKPTELSIWPLLWELPSDAYHLSELTQGAAMWQTAPGTTGQSPRPVAGDLTLTENSAVPALSAAAAALVRPKERGLNLEGTIDQAATGVRIRVLDAAGNVIQLRQNQVATTGVQEITVTPGAVSGNTKPFSAVIFFLDAVNAFGPVQIAINSVGVTPPIVATFRVHLAGLQIVLVDDHGANTNGQQPGSILNETNERIIVDFLASPQNDAPSAPTNALISAQTRARRMISYSLANHPRLLNAAVAAGPNNPSVLRPQMPMWMAEFQIVGMTRAQLEDLMTRRGQRLAGNPTTLQLVLGWRVHLEWDGPDSASGSPRLFRYSEDFPSAGPDARTVTLNLNASNQIDGVDAQGAVAGALAPAPVAPTFPVTGRRTPRVLVSGLSRAWGRHSAAVSKDSIIVEWQPSIVDSTSGAEALRGGDGTVNLPSVTIAGARIDPGAAATPPPPDLRLPVFRVLGLNPDTRANVVALTNALVADFFNSNNTLARITLLSLGVWQETARRIVFHESLSGNPPLHDFGHQFEFRGAGRRRFSGQFFGHEQDMPVFGAPHGYGFGQLDNPPITTDQAWSFFENIKETVRRIMDDKARAAFNHFTLPATAASSVDFNGLGARRRRAMYRREIVRRYNGGVEFQFEAGNWVVHTGVPVDRREYPNVILGTTVTEPGPSAFAEADFGPGI